MTENTSQPPPKRGDLDFLRSLYEHATHRGLPESIQTVNPPHFHGESGTVSLFPYDATDIALLLTWIDSMSGVSVTVGGLSNHYDHLHATGALSDGTVAKVVVLLDDVERESLRANMTVEKGAPVDIDLLRRLTSAAAAEAEAVPAVSS